MLLIRWPISLYGGAKLAVSKSTGILKWSWTNGHKIVPVLISLNRALRKNHPHQRDQIKFFKTSMQVLYAGMDSLSYSAPWKKGKTAEHWQGKNEGGSIRYLHFTFSINVLFGAAPFLLVSDPCGIKSALYIPGFRCECNFRNKTWTGHRCRPDICHEYHGLYS